MIKKVELIIEKNSIDLFGDESFPLSFSIDEINDIGKKAASYSKEINIPATQLNNQIFTSLFDVTVDGGFNPISRKYSVLLVDGIPVMRGYFKLLGVNIKDNEYITYRGLLYEEQINFIQALDEYELTNLNMPATTTTTTYTGVQQQGTFQYGNLTQQYGRKRTLSGTAIGNAIDFGSLTFSAGLWGTITQEPRSILPGVQWVPNNVGSYTATVDQNVKLTGIVVLSLTNNGTTPIQQVITLKATKLDYTNPLGGTSVQTTVLVQNYPPSSLTLAAGASATITLAIPSTMPTIQLGTGDKIKLEIYTSSPFTTFSIATSSLGGTVTTNAGTPITVTGQTFNSTAILQSIENATNADNGVVTFPLIDYSELYGFYGISASLFNNTSINVPPTMNVLNEDLRPAVYVKRIWDAIFRQAGFKYKSKFLNDTMFKSLVLTGGIDETEISSVMFSSKPNPNFIQIAPTGAPSGFGVITLNDTTDTQTLTGAAVSGYEYKNVHMGQIILSSGAANQRHPFLNEAYVDAYVTYAPSNKFNHGVAYSVHNNNGIHTLTGQNYHYGYGDISNINNYHYGLMPTAAADGKYNIKAKLSFTSYAMYPLNAPTVPLSNTTRYTLQIQKLANGSYKHSANFKAPSNDNWELLTQTTVSRAIGTAPQDLVMELNENIELKKGDMLRVVIMGDPNAQLGVPSTYGSRIKILPDTFMEFRKYGTFVNATITNYATLLPRGMKQRDFILELAKMFNLYFESDKEDDKTLIIEPRDAYYAQGVVRDYTKKIDYSKDFQIDILSHDFAKKTTFGYAEDDKDYLVTQYGNFNLNQQPFGNYIFSSPNEYNIDEAELLLKFAPSYIQKVGDTNLKITKIIDPDKKEPDGASKNVPYKIKPRIMFYKKKPMVLPTNHQVLMNEAKTLLGYQPLVLSTLNIVPTNNLSYLLTQYGYAGHLNDPDVPTMDLNWYTDFTYLPYTVPTQNNLINVFYKPQLIELSDASARRVICFVDLEAVDIHNLRFCDVYYFHKEYWRLLNINDYDTSSDVAQTTKCEFIKIVRANTNTLIDYTTFGYLGVNGGSAGGISGGIFGATDPETGQPFLMQLNGTSPVQEITQSTYFNLMAQQNNINQSLVAEAGGLDILTELNINNSFRNVEATGNIATANIASLNTHAGDKPTGDILTITREYIPSDELMVDYAYRTVLFDGVKDRRVFYNIHLFDDAEDGHTVKFDVANDSDFGIINFTNSNIRGEEFYVVNYENKIEATYMQANDMWTIKRF